MTRSNPLLHLSAVDRALAAFREDPSEENRARLLTAQQDHMTSYYQERSVEYIERTRGAR